MKTFIRITCGIVTIAAIIFAVMAGLGGDAGFGFFLLVIAVAAYFLGQMAK